jgi:hypothetical protein
MKRFIIALPALLALAFAFALPASAQFRIEAVTATNTIPAATTNSLTATVMDSTRVSEMALQINSRLGGAGTSAVVYTVQKSVDGSRYVTAFTLSATANGTNYVAVITNITTQAVPYWKVTQVENPNASAITNLAIYYGMKRNSD